MLQETALRVKDGRQFAPVLAIAGEAHRFMVSRQLRDIGADLDCLILEPEMRNTAPAIALAAHRLASTHGQNALMLVMPSDHVIAQLGAFHDAVQKAAAAARAGYIVAFGVTPERAETGYGYIEGGSKLKAFQPLRQIVAFKEKPLPEVAEAYLAGGNHLWNSGILLVSVETYLANLAALAPDILEATTAAMAKATIDNEFIRPDAEAFSRSPNLSVDYAVMEQCSHAAVVPISMGWSDVGSWQALWEIRDRDENGNAVRGDVLTIDCEDNILHVDGGPAIAACGVSNMAIISTKDSVLVVPRARAQDVRHIVGALKSGPGDLHSLPPVVHRPWGSYEPIGSGEGYQAKRIIVDPGASLSLQRHRHRSEHWVVVSGVARVTVGESIFELGPNQSTYIPVGAAHRLENPGDAPLSLIEVQCGSYLSEDDIERLADNYGRSSRSG